MTIQNKVIITCAVTGAIHTPSMSPYLPVTPEEIANAARIQIVNESHAKNGPGGHQHMSCWLWQANGGGVIPRSNGQNAKSREKKNTDPGPVSSLPVGPDYEGCDTGPDDKNDYESRGPPWSKKNAYRRGTAKNH